MIKKLLSLFFFVGILFSLSIFSFVDLNAESLDEPPTAYLTQTSSGIPIMNVSFYPRDPSSNIVSFSILDYGVAYAYESFETPNFYSNISIYAGSPLEKIGEMTFTEFQSYTGMLSLQIGGVYTVDLYQWYEDGHLSFGYMPEDVYLVKFEIVYFHETTQTEAEDYLVWLLDDGILYSYTNPVTIIGFRNYDNLFLSQSYLDDVSLTYEPNINTDYPTPTNSYFRYDFAGWLYEDGTLADLSNIDFSYNINGYISLTADYKLVMAIDGDIEDIDNTPSALDHILTVTGFNNPNGKLLIYGFILILTTVLLRLAKLETFIVILVELIIFGVFIFLGWLPIYVIIILGLIFILSLIKTFSKGGD